jgi:hypothetical protein
MFGTRGSVMIRKRFALFALFASLPTAAAQNPPITPDVPTEPRVRVIPAPETTLPRPLPTSILKPKLPEQLVAVDPKTVSVKRLNGQWELWVNDQAVRSFGDNGDDANEVARTLRELYPVRWGRIGSERTIVEYGLTLDNDQKLVAPEVAGFARSLITWNSKTLRVEQVRGMWCLRDNANLLLNFGTHQADAELALAVIQKYGFTTLGTVGRKEAVMTFFTRHVGLPPTSSILPAAAQFKVQEDAMTRTGIPVPRLGYAGEMTRIDPKKLETRNERGELSLLHGNEIIAKFGNDDWAARDATRIIRDRQFTEFCKFGTAGVTFFLSNGKAPQNLPLHTLGPRFEPTRLQVRELQGKWWLVDQLGRQLLPASSQAEGEQLVKIVQAFGFDQLCHVYSGTKPLLTFLAKGR